jgi:wyosine [tRNA(Phe)-imidazoG37] synthetase (radical SAM superfamily)
MNYLKWIYTVAVFSMLLFVVTNIVCNKPKTIDLDEVNERLETLANELDSVQSVIVLKLEMIKGIDEQKTIIQKYYYEKSNEIDTIIIDSIILTRIRDQLDRLSTAKFE